MKHVNYKYVKIADVKASYYRDLINGFNVKVGLKTIRMYPSDYHLAYISGYFKR